MCVIYLCSCVHLRVSESGSIYQYVRPRAHFYVSLSCAYNYFFVPVVCVFYNCLSTTIISTNWSKPGTTRQWKIVCACGKRLSLTDSNACHRNQTPSCPPASLTATWGIDATLLAAPTNQLSWRAEGYFFVPCCCTSRLSSFTFFYKACQWANKCLNLNKQKWTTHCMIDFKL